MTDGLIESNSFVSCMCDKLGRLCGTATPCGIPGVEDAIRHHDWAKVAALVIQGGVCTILPPVIIAMLIASILGCIFGEGHGIDRPDSVVSAEFDHHMRRYRMLSSLSHDDLLSA